MALHVELHVELHAMCDDARHPDLHQTHHHPDAGLCLQRCRAGSTVDQHGPGGDGSEMKEMDMGGH